MFSPLKCQDLHSTQTEPTVVWLITLELLDNRGSPGLCIYHTWSQRANADGFSAGNGRHWGKGKGHAERLSLSLYNQLT